MRKFIMSLTTVASLSLAAVPVLGLTQAANAAERDHTVSIAYGDLNLASPAHAALFKARIDTAGEALCRAKMRDGTLDLPMRGCVAEVHREVERQLSPDQRKALALAAQSHDLAAR